MKRESTDLGMGASYRAVPGGSAGAGFNGDGASDCDGEGGKSRANGMLGGNITTPGGFGGGGDGGRGTGNRRFAEHGRQPKRHGQGRHGRPHDRDRGSQSAAIPTLSEGGMILLIGLLPLGAFALRRRRIWVDSLRNPMSSRQASSIRALHARPEAPGLGIRVDEGLFEKYAA